MIKNRAENFPKSRDTYRTVAIFGNNRSKVTPGRIPHGYNIMHESMKKKEQRWMLE